MNTSGVKPTIVFMDDFPFTSRTDYALWRVAGMAGEASRIKAIPFKAPRIFIRESSSGTLYWTTETLDEWRRM